MGTATNRTWSYTTTDEHFGLGYPNEHFGLFEIDEMLLIKLLPCHITIKK